MRLLRRMRYFLHQRRAEADLAEELEFHRAMNREAGGSLREMGNMTHAREEARAVWIWPWLESVWRDAAYGWRNLVRQPGFALVALLALTCAIGLNTTLFTIFNAIALRPWPVRDPGRVVSVARAVREGAAGFGVAEYRYVAAHSRTFSGLMVAENGEQVRLEKRSLQATYVTANYFRVLGVDMQRGRGFMEEEDRAAGPRAVAVISDALWRNAFGGDPAIAGRRVRLEDIPFTIVGVTPAGFSGTSPMRNDMWTPLAARKLLRPHDPGVESYLTSPYYCCIHMAGRLAPGVTRGQAQAEVSLLSDRFRTQNGLERGGRALVSGTAWMGNPSQKRQAAPALLLLFMAVTLVLLLACSNVGNLLVARAGARRKEIAVRLSLGGSRARLVRQLLVESMILAIAAAALGLAMAYVLPPAAMAWLASDVVFQLKPDGTVLAYTAAVAAVACLAFGLAPALHATRGSVAAALKAEARSGPARLPLRTVLLAVQVSISVILLSAAGLLVRGLARTSQLDPGFDYQNVTAMQLDVPLSLYSGPRAGALARQLLAQVEHAPGLVACGLSLDMPLGNSTTSTSFEWRGRRQPILLHDVSPGYFETLRIPIIGGRNFDAPDIAQNVTILNEAAVRRYWPGENVVGRTLSSNGKSWSIVGVAKDAYTTGLGSVEPAMYWPLGHRDLVPLVLVRARSAGGLAPVMAIVKQLAPRAAIQPVALADNFDRQVAPSRYAALVSGFLGFLALLLASVGMAGVFAYVVSQRTREIGVRMALGASPPQVVRLVLGSSLRALLYGVLAGVAGAAAVSTLLVHVLPGVRASEPAVYGGVLALLVLAAGLASAVPARRATRIDPVRALRWE